MKLILGLILIAIAFIVFNKDVKPPSTPAPKPEVVLQLEEVPIVKNIVKEDSLYSSIINRAKTPYLDKNQSRSTQAHETTHFIHADLRNASGNRAFFIPPNQAFYCRGANFKKSQIIPYIPPSVRYNRFNVYLLGAKDWEDYPLYVFDEWTAYINGGSVALEDYKNGIPRSSQIDTVMGCLEFSIYSISTCMAIKDLDPELWSDEQFRLFVKYNLKRASDTFFEGKKIFSYNRQDDLLNRLINDDDCGKIRDFINSELDGIFINDSRRNT